MDLFSFIATIILITSVVSLVMAFAAYVAYKVREVRKPIKNKHLPAAGKPEPIFLKRAIPETLLKEWTKASTDSASK
ncbi:MAG: hypothetical protein ACOH2B_09365 [Burkholderiaceae bacterium]